jgi:hypothetical protein
LYKLLINFADPDSLNLDPDPGFFAESVTDPDQKFRLKIIYFFDKKNTTMKNFQPQGEASILQEKISWGKKILNFFIF